MGEKLADEQADSILHRIAVNGGKRIVASHFTHHGQFPAATGSCLEIDERERHEHGIAHACCMCLSQRNGKRHESSQIGIDVHNIVPVAVSNGVQHYALELLIHAANILIIWQSKCTKC